MSMELLVPGDRLLVVNRRLYERDDNRLFVGEVEAFHEGIIRITGYTFVRDVLGGTIHRKSEPRTKLLSLTAGTLLVYVLPQTLQLNDVTIECDEARTWLTDGDRFSMNLSEWVRK